MKSNLQLQRAEAKHAESIAHLVGELLQEIMSVTGVTSFHFDAVATAQRLNDWLTQQHYIVFIAVTESGMPIGFISLTQCYALYAEGSFGIIPECYVQPAYRSQGVGAQLITQARQFAHAQGWQRLEVTTPSLPAFEATLAFYQQQGFEISGGRKLKLTV